MKFIFELIDVLHEFFIGIWKEKLWEIFEILFWKFWFYDFYGIFNIQVIYLTLSVNIVEVSG